jgi:hypothetical protein
MPVPKSRAARTDSRASRSRPVGIVAIALPRSGLSDRRSITARKSLSAPSASPRRHQQVRRFDARVRRRVARWWSARGDGTPGRTSQVRPRVFACDGSLAPRRCRRGRSRADAGCQKCLRLQAAATATPNAAQPGTAGAPRYSPRDGVVAREPDAGDAGPPHRLRHRSSQEVWCRVRAPWLPPE